jgi:hypothetical protein
MLKLRRAIVVECDRPLEREHDDGAGAERELLAEPIGGGRARGRVLAGEPRG